MQSALDRRCARLIDAARPRVVLIDLRAVPDLEYTALKMLSEAEERQREAGISLWLVGLNPEVLASSSARRSASDWAGTDDVQPRDRGGAVPG
jgi:MFS superfamily sulfate permease-like transporter